MIPNTTGLCILGSTGSIGRNCLCVVRSLPGRFRIISLSAGRNLDALAEQIVEFSPQLVAVAVSELMEPLRERLRARAYRRSINIVAGPEGQVEASTHRDVDFVVSASHGITGLVATLRAVEAGKRLGLANKETLVVAGDLVTAAARKRGSEVLPIDSEHSAVHQCLRSGRSQEVRRLILTASGGPFLRTRLEAFDSITPDEALKHPVWKMGGRVTVDSATLMNKGLEIMEAHWLFGFPSQRIEVLIHPESIVHSMVEFQDRSMVAQLSTADMRIPIQYALTYPERVAANGSAVSLDLLQMGGLHFELPDDRRFPCLTLGRAALEGGGNTGCVLNAADEVAVEAFLAGRLPFSRIPQVIEQAMERFPAARLACLDDVLKCDAEARRRATELVARIQ